MCGIGVYIDKKAVRQNRVKKLIDFARISNDHRGPDNFEYAVLHDGKVILFHNRLSLVDLSKAGNQPMEKHGRTIVFNGEIYNFRLVRTHLEEKGYLFSTQTDTEVILSAYDHWGSDCVQQLNGAFAFAIYDAAKGEVFIARDRVGEKPLYQYQHSNGATMIASSLSQIMRSIPRTWQVDEKRIAGDLIFNFWSDKSRSHIKDISVVPAATCQKIDIATGAQESWEYWRVPSDNDDSLDEATAISMTESLLVDSIDMRKQMDAPYGVILSGGLDSTLLTGMCMRNTTEQMNVYTLHRVDQTDEDSKHALMYSAERPQIKHTFVNISDSDMSAHSMIKTTEYMEEPLLDHVYIYINRNYEEARKSGLKAVLNGQGADELYLGYLDHYPFLRDRGNYESREVFADMWNTTSSSVMRHMKVVHAQEIIRETLDRCYEHDEADTLNGVLRFGMRTHLPALLSQEDKQSMRWSIECRTCYTDYRLVELAAKIPSRIKMFDNKEKYPLRRVAEKYIPQHIITRKKLGFPSLDDQKVLTIKQLLEEDILRQSPFIRDNFEESLFKAVHGLPFEMKWKLVAIALYDLHFVQPLNEGARQH